MRQPERRRRPIVARWVYLALAILGLAFPARLYASFFVHHGFDLHQTASVLGENLLITASVSAIAITTTATVVFIFTECLARRDPSAIYCIPLTLFFGIGFGLPFYLFIRLRRRGA